MGGHTEDAAGDGELGLGLEDQALAEGPAEPSLQESLPVSVEERCVEDDLLLALLAVRREGLSWSDPALDLVSDGQHRGQPSHGTAIVRTQERPIQADLHGLVARLAHHGRQQGQLSV